MLGAAGGAKAEKEGLRPPTAEIDALRLALNDRRRSVLPRPKHVNINTPREHGKFARYLMAGPVLLVLAPPSMASRTMKMLRECMGWKKVRFRSSLN